MLRIALANLLKEQGQVSEALSLYAVSLAKQKASHGPTSPVVAVSMTNMADMHLRLGSPDNLAQAIALYEEALRIMETHKGKTHPTVGSIVASMGSVYDQLGQHGASMMCFERALKIKQQALGPDHVGNCVLLNNMATSLAGQGRHQDALAMFKRSLQIREETQGTDHPHVAPTLANIGRLYLAMADARAAARDAKRAEANSSKNANRKGGDHSDDDGDGDPDASGVFGASLDVGEEDLESAQYISEAVIYFKRAVTIIDTAFGPTHISLIDVLDDLAKSHSRAGLHFEALAGYQREIQIFSQQQALAEADSAAAAAAAAAEASAKGAKGAAAKGPGPSKPPGTAGLSVDIARVLGKQAQVYSSGLGNTHKAIECLTAQCEILESFNGPNDTELADALFVLSSLYLDVDREQDSLICIRRCYNARLASLGPDSEATMEAKTWLYDIAGTFTSHHVSPVYHLKQDHFRKLMFMYLIIIAHISALIYSIFLVYILHLLCSIFRFLVVDQDDMPFESFDPATFDFDNCHVNMVAAIPLSDSDNSAENSRTNAAGRRSVNASASAGGVSGSTGGRTNRRAPAAVVAAAASSGRGVTAEQVSARAKSGIEALERAD